ncbi:hypothetical protein ACP8H2_09475 [Bacillus subtilis]|uniref:hypothetical protein n=1 Tax=Bacillus subtilis TaxID=1423 RepID=UPI003CEB75E2
MNYKYNEIMKAINKGMNPLLVYKISKEEVLEMDMKGLDKFFKVVDRVGTPVRQSVVIMCDGYNDIPDELYQIPEVSKFVKKMFRRFPHILYYINNDTDSYFWMLACLADEVTSMKVGDYETTQLSAYEIAEKFGVNRPEVGAYVNFKGDKLATILKPIVDYGKKIGDKDAAIKIAVEYALIFEHPEKTLMEMGVDKWNIK